MPKPTSNFQGCNNIRKLSLHCLESGGFLSFLELQKSLLVSFPRGAENNGKGLKALALTIFEYFTAFSQNMF